MKWYLNEEEIYILIKKKYINIIFIINMVKPIPTVIGRQHYLGCQFFRYKSQNISYLYIKDNINDDICIEKTDEYILAYR